MNINFIQVFHRKHITALLYEPIIIFINIYEVENQNGIILFFTV